MRIGIYGYGNLGRGVELAAARAEDMELVGIFTRRDPATVQPQLAETRVYAAGDILKFQDQIDVLVICGGSATDLPVLTPELAANFNVVDSFDTHAKIREHMEKVGRAAEAGGNLALISAGWDPGLFSLARAYATAILPDAVPYTFWGRGVSQGHSDAIRRLPGVADARQYTVPIEEALSAVRKGGTPALSAGEKHRRECYVVLKPGADPEAVSQAIKTMPNYFAEYETEVHFISQEEMERDHRAMPHGGTVICSGKTGVEREHKQVVEFALHLDSNPEFTASVLTACARAVHKMRTRGRTGCISVLDVAPSDFSTCTSQDLCCRLL